MNLLTVPVTVYRGMLLILICFHLGKHQYKTVKSTILTLILSFLPALADRWFGVQIDAFSLAIYYIMLFMSLYLGSSLGFYDRYAWWDRAIHSLSGIGFTGFGIAIAYLSPGIGKAGLLFFGFTFSLSLHLIWEVMEYLSDCVTHGNAQRWQKIHNSVNHVSEKAIQPAGLVDTMNDSICCMIGAALVLIFWWIVL